MTTRAAFLRRIRQRFFLRFHMSLILAATVLSGVLSNVLLYRAGLEGLLYRYPLAVATAYGCFFLFVRIWLWYVSPSRGVKSDLDPGDLDLLDVPSWPSASPGSPLTPAGKGGAFGGGGASGGYEAEGIAPAGPGEPRSPLDGVDLDLDLDEKSGLALLLLGLLLAVIFGAAVYLVYQGPTILAEAAFEGMLAAGLIRRTRQIDDPDWAGSVLRATWIPFTIVLALTVAVAGYLHTHHPQVTRLIELVR